jgi:hypothetical protein
MLLKQSTARNRPVLMVASADHIAGSTGLTLTITASKNGAAFASITPTVTELANGWYNLALTTTHTNTLGALALHITSSGADATDLLDEVVTDLPGDTVSSVTGNVGGNVAGSVASVTTSVTVSSLDATATNLKKNVGSQGPIPFIMTDSTNHAPATGKTVSATVSKDGVGFVAAGGSVAEVGVGVYAFSPSQTDANCKFGVLRFTATGCDDTFEFFVTDP